MPKRAMILFDGAMSNAEVYLNGKKVGYWPYGYNSFYFDVTDCMRANAANTLAVRLENLPESSRWYPGAGLYRNVHVIVTDDAHIPVWGTRSLCLRGRIRLVIHCVRPFTIRTSNS